ncbi:TOTE conflict system archaeo-eukaryotic primase domain-containing protein [Bacillus sp. KH172YL63]|uniref:TOTE conflict system archaeo-eukaryotic primase domain-containing protein n=1 Tax=Bacillus sp. KH172YL63 TaxID=2709784 RepID=UPI0013E41BD6|nr:DEAD/DEAH box helicase [Bacillus sp. KH172YL63]BCB05733.1 helicase [Bacillus sp. KH172YL63]
MTNNKLKLQQVLLECQQLQNENRMLKALLDKHNIPYEGQSQNQMQRKERQQIIKDRIRLFSSLFVGRKDVYALRWESIKNGNSGYTPACKHEWHPTLCQKPHIKCGQCMNKAYLPMTEEVIYNHLSGKQTVGIYPLQSDDTCFFLAVDFDKGSWRQDVQAFIKVCKSHDLHVALELSRSGNGAHVWLFFEEAIKASLARKLGFELLSKTMEQHFSLGIDSFDRLFPNQDILPKGGLGNLIALPLQGESRKKGNSVFLDEELIPIGDQWQYLASIRKISYKKINSIIKNPQSGFNENKISSESKPAEITIILKNGLYIDKNVVPSFILKKLMDIAVFNNPAYYKAQAKRLSTHHIPRVINCADQTEKDLILPRGCLEDVLAVCEESGIGCTVKDETIASTKLELEFKGTLYPQQKEAVEKLSQSNHGVLSATTGFGKTVIGAAMIHKRKVNTLVIVHRKQLMKQWKTSLSSLFHCEESAIGEIGGGKNTPNGLIDIATIQTLGSNSEKENVIQRYSHIIVDECHHISALTFERVLKKSSAKHVLGLTATPTRKDGLHPIMTMQCGPIRYKVSAKQQSKVHSFNHLLCPRLISGGSEKATKATIQEIMNTLQTNETRNLQIFNDVLHALEEGRSPIILTERQKHIDILVGKLQGFARNIIVLKGGLKKKEEQARLKQLKELPDTEERVIIATGKYIGEGFDDPRLDTLFLTMPISWKGTLQQYVGRLHRSYPSKMDVKVYDYVDHQIPVLKKMYEKRLEGYRSLGYKVEGKEKKQGEQMKLF